MLLIKQLYTSCLAQACYYIESNGEAAVIDPLRDIEQYTALLQERGTQLKYIFETHFHADFVSGHQDLSKATGAAIVFGPGATPAYEAHVAADRTRFTLGDVVIELWHTPGHTLESSCFILYQNGQPYCAFTGDTLFIGDVGRPDLVQKVKKEITPEILASKLYDSLYHQLMLLPDETIIYPGHGAGSACGKHMSKETSDTIGHQKQFNYAFKPSLQRDEFVRLVLQGLTEPPQYFPQNVMRNVLGSDKSYDEIMEVSCKPLSPLQCKELINSHPELIILDTRKKEDYCRCHIPLTLFTGLDDHFAPWVGTIIDNLNTPIILVVDDGREEEAVKRLSRVGFDHCLGYLQGGVDAWSAAGYETTEIACITADDLATKMAQKENVLLLDVRRNNEFQLAHIQGGVNIPVDYLQSKTAELPSDIPIQVHCAGGYRSVIACSILERLGFKYLTNVLGGFQALKQTSLPQITQQIEVIDI